MVVSTGAGKTCAECYRHFPKYALQVKRYCEFCHKFNGFITQTPDMAARVTEILADSKNQL